MRFLGRLWRRFELGCAGLDPDPRDDFGSMAYQRHNARRLEHLASLSIPVSGSTVLEVGAGIGDHTTYFLDRDCLVTITEVRDANLQILRARYPAADVQKLDLEHPASLQGTPFEVVYCYGVLYHLRDPAGALGYLAASCSGLLLLETCVSFGNEVAIHAVFEDARSSTQAASGHGCRPTRPWVVGELQRHFPYVYMPLTQPNHEEFPIDWQHPQAHEGLSRAVFVASRDPIDNDLLSTTLPMRQSRQP